MRHADGHRLDPSIKSFSLSRRPCRRIRNPGLPASTVDTLLGGANLVISTPIGLSSSALGSAHYHTQVFNKRRVTQPVAAE